MKWSHLSLAVIAALASTGCWRPYYGHTYAQPAYPQAPPYQAAPVVQQAPVMQPAPIVQQAPVYQQPVYQQPVYQQSPVVQAGACVPCPQTCTPCY
jgi:hypothetical protein